MVTLALLFACGSAETPLEPEVSVPEVAKHPPIEVAAISETQKREWLDFAQRLWWLEGEEIPCDGVVERAQLKSGVTGTTGLGLTCTPEGGEKAAWWPRGDAACPTGSALQGAPPPILDMVVCMTPAGVGNGAYTFWHRTGELQRVGSTVNGQPEGVTVSLRPDGGIDNVSHFEKGLQHGLTVHFWPGGQPAVTMPYDKGVLSGLSTTWHQNGIVALQANYVGGQLDGNAEFWGDDGRHCGTSTLTAGTGSWTKYWRDCTVQQRGQMENGVNVGVWEEFDRAGNRASRSPSGR